MRMVHPDVEGHADVITVAVFREVWEPRGWRLVGDHPFLTPEDEAWVRWHLRLAKPDGAMRVQP